MFACGGTRDQSAEKCEGCDAERIATPIIFQHDSAVALHPRAGFLWDILRHQHSRQQRESSASITSN